MCMSTAGRNHRLGTHTVNFGQWPSKSFTIRLYILKIALEAKLPLIGLHKCIKYISQMYGTVQEGNANQ